MAGLLGSLGGEGRLPGKLLEAASHLEQPYPILQAISEQLVFLLSQKTTETGGENHWKAYRCTDYCVFSPADTQFLSGQNNRIFLTTINELFYEF